LAVSQLRELARRGFAEVVLTGVHLGRYGTDLGSSLAKLISRLEAEPDMPSRLRLSSIEPQELSPDLIETIAGSSRFCPHFHVPLQSGDDAVLRAMGRPYRASHFEALVQNIKAHLPSAALGIDLIAGFPGETEKSHERTAGLVSRLPISYFHVFPFSPRPKTRAFDLPGRVPDEEVKARARDLRELGRRKKREFLSEQQGRELTILAEEWKEGVAAGTSENFVRAEFKASRGRLGSLVRVRVKGLSAGRVMADAVRPGAD